MDASTVGDNHTTNTTEPAASNHANAHDFFVYRWWYASALAAAMRGNIASTRHTPCGQKASLQFRCPQGRGSQPSQSSSTLFWAQTRHSRRCLKVCLPFPPVAVYLSSFFVMGIHHRKPHGLFYLMKKARRPPAIVSAALHGLSLLRVLFCMQPCIRCVHVSPWFHVTHAIFLVKMFIWFILIDCNVSY